MAINKTVTIMSVDSIILLEVDIRWFFTLFIAFTVFPLSFTVAA